MRVTGIVIAAALLVSASASAQTPQTRQPLAGSSIYPYALDPYNPSDAALLRKYGPALIAQTPIQELRKLDPYKPSQAAILRQDAAIPVWGASWYAYPVPAAPGSMTLFPAERPAPERPAPAVVSGNIPPREISTVLRPETNDGIFITYQQRRWISAGRAVPSNPSFVRVGTYAGLDVYRRASDPADMLFVPTMRDGGMLAPFRMKP